MSQGLVLAHEVTLHVVEADGVLAERDVEDDGRRIAEGVEEALTVVDHDVDGETDAALAF
jgi:hypothetical protein